MRVHETEEEAAPIAKRPIVTMLEKHMLEKGLTLTSMTERLKKAAGGRAFISTPIGLGVWLGRHPQCSQSEQMRGAIDIVVAECLDLPPAWEGMGVAEMVIEMESAHEAERPLVAMLEQHMLEKGLTLQKTFERLQKVAGRRNVGRDFISSPTGLGIWLGRHATPQSSRRREAIDTVSNSEL